MTFCWCWTFRGWWMNLKRRVEKLEGASQQVSGPSEIDVRLDESIDCYYSGQPQPEGAGEAWEKFSGLPVGRQFFRNLNKIYGGSDEPTKAS